LSCLSVCDIGVLWPTGWMDQDETWHRGRPRPRPHCIRWRPSPPPKKGHSIPLIFGPWLLWPNGWMDQDAIWYGSRPRPRPHCVRWGPSLRPKRTQQPPLLAHVYCGQTAGWINLPLGREAGFSPGDIVHN